MKAATDLPDVSGWEEEWFTAPEDLFALGLGMFAENTKKGGLITLSGQQKAHKVVEGVRALLTESGLDNCLSGVWEQTSPYGWGLQPRSLANSAIMYRDASLIKKLSDPAAEWLTFWGLSAIPNWAHRPKARMNGIRWSKQRQSNYFIYPVWEQFLGFDEAYSLIGVEPGAERGCMWRAAHIETSSKDYRAVSPSRPYWARYSHP